MASRQAGGDRRSLKIDQTYLVSGVTSGARDPLQVQRLQMQKDLRVHQGAGMNEQQAHHDLCR
ncbi:hypothetical protein M271_20190 [Streptomyces rapamycinicus NRRL 5491]|nr:hypothetical protein M271_20190 [Streptomyces rapamycinicus NRRL 5491]